MPTRERSRLSAQLLRGEATIALAMGVMNVATYAFNVVAARVLGPRSYGALAALLAVLLVLGVLQLGLQATAARRIAADPGHVAQIERAILRVTYRAAAVLGLLTLFCAPLLAWLLRIEDLLSVVLVAAAAVPMTITGGQAGILQGERRWGALALVYLAMGVPRLAIGLALVTWRPDETAAMLAVVLSYFVPLAVGWWVLRLPRRRGSLSEEHGSRRVAWEAIRNSQTLLAFFALSNADVIVARNVLDDHQAGLYAGGLILTKAVLFLPQFVVVVAFPAMSTREQSRSALLGSLFVVSTLGAVATLGSLLLADLALVFVGGEQYDELTDQLWRFAVLGTCLALLQLLVYSVLARQGRRSIYLLWAALALIPVAGLASQSEVELVTAVTLIDAGLLVALLVISLRRPTTDASHHKAPPGASHR